MRYRKLKTIHECATGPIVTGSRSDLARLVRSTQDRDDRKEVIRRAYWVGLPQK